MSKDTNIEQLGSGSIHTKEVDIHSGIKHTHKGCESTLNIKHTHTGCEPHKTHHRGCETHNINTPTRDVKEQQTNHTSRPVDVVEEISDKSPSLLPKWELLRQKVRLIVMSIDVTGTPFTPSHTFPDKVIGNAL